MNDNNLVASQPLNGLQMGEYFGFSLLAIDLNGDEYAHSYNIIHSKVYSYNDSIFYACLLY